VQRNFYTAATLFLGPILAPAAHLSQSADSAFRSYIATVEARLRQQHEDPDRCVALLSGDREQARNAMVRDVLAGSVRTEPLNAGRRETGGALLHHWRAAAFVPDAGTKDMIRVLRDYENLPRYYAPEVVSARRVSGDAVAVRFKRRMAITVVLDAEFRTQSGLSGVCGYQTSRSTHIWEVDNAGSAEERRRVEGEDDGFLWRLNSYWSFVNWGRGVLIECEAVSLTRDVPAGLGWIISPLIDSVPRESIEFTMTATRNALLESIPRSRPDAH